MPIETLSYAETGYFSRLICDYLAEKEALKPFYGLFPKETNFETQLANKKASFNTASRELLIESLKEQYMNVAISKTTKNNIESLSEENTFTITTGHQLNLFTGPLYFLYKIFSVINLCEALNKKHNNRHFVPVYWMATEDHDFEEINYFNLNGRKIQWDKAAGGAVGELPTEGLDKVLDVFRKELGEGEHVVRLISLFSEAYLRHDNLSDATRYLANELFKDYGLVIIDGNNAMLKNAFIPYIEKELKEQLSNKKVTETTKRLADLGYPEQVYSREINLFYLKEGLRERIIEKNGRYHINRTSHSFSLKEILEELHDHPERFSPNALLRPLYQEVVLPNLCYIGGGGELAYWLQLKDYFEEVEVPFPMLLLRNSVLMVSEKLSEKLKKLNVTTDELFLSQHDLKNLHTRRVSEININFSKQRKHLREQFKDMYVLAKKTDASFLGAVGAQEKKQLNGLDYLEKRLLKAQRKRLADELERLTVIQNELFPGESLQERTNNFSEFYLFYGPELFSELKKQIDPLVNKFTVLRW